MLTADMAHHTSLLDSRANEPDIKDRNQCITGCTIRGIELDVTQLQRFIYYNATIRNIVKNYSVIPSGLVSNINLLLQRKKPMNDDDNDTMYDPIVNKNNDITIDNINPR